MLGNELNSSKSKRNTIKTRHFFNRCLNNVLQLKPKRINRCFLFVHQIRTCCICIYRHTHTASVTDVTTNSFNCNTLQFGRTTHTKRIFRYLFRTSSKIEFFFKYFTYKRLFLYKLIVDLVVDKVLSIPNKFSWRIILK